LIDRLERLNAIIPLSTLIGPFIAILALLFTVATFWWLNARQGKLRSYPPYSFGFSSSPGQALLRFPIVLYNTGPKPIIVQDIRLKFRKQRAVQPLPWRTSRSQLKPVADEATSFQQCSQYRADRLSSTSSNSGLTEGTPCRGSTSRLMRT
jgi:hypothetical protein